MTAVITGERGDGTLTRQGLEEYVSDCVILLDHRVTEQVSTRRLRVVKYRGSLHGTNEYPFLIDEDGHLGPADHLARACEHAASDERVSTGVAAARRDARRRGLLPRQQRPRLRHGGHRQDAASPRTSPTPPAGAASAASTSPSRSRESQIVRNMRSIGIDLRPWLDEGPAAVPRRAARPLYGLEMHLAPMHKLVREFQPRVVVVDPITNFLDGGHRARRRGDADAADRLPEGRADHRPVHQPDPRRRALEQTEVGISSLIDTWLLLRDIESGGERNRGLYVLKSRGMGHSNQVREFLLTDQGIELVDVYLGPEGVLTGSARLAEAARERTAAAAREEEIERKQRELDLRRQVMEARIATLRTEFKMEEEQLKRLLAEEGAGRERLTQERAEILRGRQTGSLPPQAMDRTPTR